MKLLSLRMVLPQPYATRKSSRNLKHHSTSEKCSKEVVAVETLLETIGATTWSRSGAEGTMMRVASLLVAFSLLFPDAPVGAEGAWVVWRTSKGTWEPIRVWATQKECDADLPRYAAPTDRTLLVDAIVFGWICLPDTVDPRGPKRK